MTSPRSLLRIARQPVPPETRQLLDAAWARLPPSLRTPNQFLGRHYAGCGATIGAMPRCDFACRGCYLGEAANQVPAASLAEVMGQLRVLRAWLGHGGNLQLTDGEVLLRPETEVIALIREARAMGLVPMLMTHGDGFRRRPGLLERLMTEGGLTEVSIHVDTTQRGRLGDEYRNAMAEEDLMPLREEFAGLIRSARRRTGHRLEVATTLTVTRDNLAGVPAVIRWIVANADAFKMISFQPLSQVGRTEAGLVGVGVAELWSAIADGLGDAAPGGGGLDVHQGWLGHPGCSRFVQGLVVSQTGGPPAFRPLLETGIPGEKQALAGWLERFGGLTFRLDTRAEALARLAGILTTAPTLVIGRVLPFLVRLATRLDRAHPARFVGRWLSGRARVDYLNIVSHHFMSRPELSTPSGQERLAACVFKVPIGGQLVSMCEANALGLRDRYYDTLRRAARC